MNKYLWRSTLKPVTHQPAQVGAFPNFLKTLCGSSEGGSFQMSTSASSRIPILGFIMHYDVKVTSSLRSSTGLPLLLRLTRALDRAMWTPPPHSSSGTEGVLLTPLAHSTI